MIKDVDLLICGAGPVGCVLAERAANALGWKVLLVERRDHIAGNCFDALHDNGVMIHRYGPHYFRTNHKSVARYLSRFTDWIPGNYVVKSCVQNRLYPFPINLTTLEQFFGKRLTPESAERLLEEKRVNFSLPRNSEEFVLSRVGRELYESFYLNYTRKQWELHPRQLRPEVCGRIPIRFNRDERYVNHKFQKMPRRGFTAMFASMINHRKIRVLLGCDFFALRKLIKPRFATVYTGPIDKYFHYRYGKLPYRSLTFDFVPYATDYKQPCVQINYPNDHSYTRSVEIKHVTRQEHPHTVVSYETPQAQGEPFYPVHTPENLRLYSRYRDLAEAAQEQERVYFCGRLAQYRYFNTDEVILEALQCFKKIRQRCTQPQDRSVLLSPSSTM